MSARLRYRPSLGHWISPGDQFYRRAKVIATRADSSAMAHSQPSLQQGSHAASPAGTRLRRLAGEEGGGALVEFAVTIPVFLLLVTGILSFGLAYSNYLMLTQATAVGARQLAVSRGQTLDPCNTVATAVYAAAPLLKPGNMTFTLTLNGVSYPNTTTCSGTIQAGAPSNLILGTKAVVNVTYPASLSLFGDLISTGFSLTAQVAELVQ